MAPQPDVDRGLPLRALVLDAECDQALAAIRSLGKHGAVITAASHDADAVGFASRYTTQRLTSPQPGIDPGLYSEWVLETLQSGAYNITLCSAEASADLLSKQRAAVQKLTCLPMPPREIFLAAARKDRLARLAAQIGIAVPATYELERLEDVAGLAPQLTFPVLVKDVRRSGGQQAELVVTPERLVATVERIAGLRRDPALPLPILQEKIDGTGYGFTALMRRGQSVAVFMHECRGGRDVGRGMPLAHQAAGARSVEEPELRAAGLALLEALCWEGIAMLEFRRSRRDGRFYLIEVNPRFVGSLELAIAAGVDFPWLYAQLAIERPIVGPNRYRVGLRYHRVVSWSDPRPEARRVVNVMQSARQRLGVWGRATRALGQTTRSTIGRSGDLDMMRSEQTRKATERDLQEVNN